MRKMIIMLLLLTGVTFNGYSQHAAKAKTILAEVSKKYKSYQVVKATFSFTIDNPKAKIKNTENGTLYVKANANKYKMIMDERELISDGKNQWTHLVADQEVQLTTVDNSSDALNPAQIFTLYEKGFSPLYTGEKKTGTKVYQTIELTPLDKRKSYSKVILSIDKTAKQIAKVLVLEKDGSKYTYLVKSFVPNVKVPESTFTFNANKYPGVEVVDLR
ncbi:LolA family protein [Pedobacter immunditicola]|uniref:LolA family protein n=1 Tax=Pedobacter immunditicola TaxID=3133440 RepID=UPI0030A0E26C